MKWLKSIFPSSKNKKSFKIENLDPLLRADDISKSMIELHSQITTACDYGDDLEVLSEPQKNFYLVQTLVTEVNHGGLDSYFYHSYGNYAHETLIALRAIGSKEVAGILQQAIDEFPDKSVPKDHGEREGLLIDGGLSEKAESAWSKLDNIIWKGIKDDIDALCHRYIMNNRDAF